MALLDLTTDTVIFHPECPMHLDAQPVSLAQALPTLPDQSGLHMVLNGYLLHESIHNTCLPTFVHLLVRHGVWRGLSI